MSDVTAETEVSESKADRAYHAIKERVESGRYGPGYRIVLDQIARELSVSPVPVREAVRRLEAEGYLVFTRNQGARVASIDPDQFAYTMQALAILEGAATAQAAPLLTPETLAEAHAINDRMRASMTAFDPAAFTSQNQEFHQLLCSACPNPHLCSLIEREWSRLALIRRSSFAFVPGRAQASVQEHEYILNLIEQHAPAEEIERVARAHKLGTLGAFQEQNNRGTE